MAMLPQYSYLSTLTDSFVYLSILESEFNEKVSILEPHHLAWMWSLDFNLDYCQIYKRHEVLDTIMFFSKIVLYHSRFH